MAQPDLEEADLDEDELVVLAQVAEAGDPLRELHHPLDARGDVGGELLPQPAALVLQGLGRRGGHLLVGAVVLGRRKLRLEEEEEFGNETVGLEDAREVRCSMDQDKVVEVMPNRRKWQVSGELMVGGGKEAEKRGTDDVIGCLGER